MITKKKKKKSEFFFFIISAIKEILRFTSNEHPDIFIIKFQGVVLKL